jgi:hypothetical protein
MEGGFEQCLQFPLGTLGPAHRGSQNHDDWLGIWTSHWHSLLHILLHQNTNIILNLVYRIWKSYCNEDNKCLTQSTSHRMGHLVIYQDNLARPHLSYIFNNEPYPTPSDYILVRTVNKLSNKSPLQLMHSPTKHRRPKIPLFNLNAGFISADREQ